MIGNLRDVNQAVHTGHDFGKCAEGHHVDDLHGSNVADLVLIGEDLPGIHFLGLIAKGNALFLGIEVLDKDIDVLAELNHGRGMLDVSPGQLGGMYHTVHTAKINKSTVGHEALYNTVIMLADFDILPKFFFLCGALFAEHFADGSDGAAALLVDIDDLHALRGAHELCHVGAAGQAGLGCGDKHLCAADIDQSAFFHGLNDLAGENGALLICLENILPVVNAVNTLFGQGCRSVDITDAERDCFDLVADFVHRLDVNGRIVRNIVEGQNAGHFGADIHMDLGRGDRSDNALNNISCI